MTSFQTKKGALFQGVLPARRWFAEGISPVAHRPRAPGKEQQSQANPRIWASALKEFLAPFELCHPAHISEEHLELHVPVCNPRVAGSAQMSAALCLPCQLQKHLHKPGLSPQDISVVVFTSRKSHQTGNGANVSPSCSS